MTRLAPLLTSLVAAAALTLVGTPAATALGPTAIAPGYDLFRTDPNVTSIGVPGVLEPIHFRGVPIETYNFGTGPTAVADTDTIVQRAGVAPQQPVGTVQLVKLQMQGVEEPTLFITLQSDRGRNPADPAVGPPSTGLLRYFFSPEGSGGSFDSNINVNFDVRAGSIDGPILASASLVLGATGTPWQHLPDAPGVLRCMTHPEFATNADVLARHGICGPPVLVPHVNDKLNGFDASNDFHPGTVGLVATPAGEITIHNIPDAAHPLGQPTVLAVPAGWGCIDTATSAAIFAGYHFTGNPAVRCDGPAGTTNLCLATGSVGYGATSGFMRIVSACGALPNADTGAFTATGHASSVGAGLFAWTCDITVPVGPAFIDWWAHCSVNRPA